VGPVTSTEVSTGRRHARLVHAWSEDDEYVATLDMLECSFIVAATTQGVDELEQLMENLYTAETEEESWEAADAFFAVLFRSRHQCEGDSVFAFIDLYRVGFSDQTIECVGRSLGGTDEVAQLMLRVNTQPDPSWTDIEALYNIGDELLDEVIDCQADDEGRLVATLKNYYLTTLDEDESTTF